ncbi:hypothetical protein [Dysgonomonas sp.]
MDVSIFKAVITYTFKKGSREDFEEFLDECGFEKQEDQSTYAMPYYNSVDINEVCEAMEEYCSENLKKGDIVDFFTLVYIDKDKKEVGMELVKYRG